MEAKGTFKFTISPAETSPFEQGMGVVRYEIDKAWTGDFVGSSNGEMLATSTESTGSRAYVTIEKVTGKLNGKSGTFCFAHKAVMIGDDATTSEMTVEVIKGSGTGELAGLRGELNIIIDDAGNHSYLLDYQAPND